MKTFKRLVLESLNNTSQYDATFFCPGFDKLSSELQDKVKHTFEFYYNSVKARGICSTFNIFNQEYKDALLNSELKEIEDGDQGPKFIITNISCNPRHRLGLESLLGDILRPFSNQFCRDRVDKYLENVYYDDVYRKKINADPQLYRTIKYTVKSKYDHLIKRMPELEGLF